MTGEIIFQKDYSDESFIDLDEDIRFMYEDEQMDGIPKDEHGFRSGTFRVTIEWFPEELA